MINNMGSEKYFDINAFLIHVLRHIGLWGSLIILFGVLGFVVSFVPDSRAYFNYTEDASFSQNQVMSVDYPYIYTAQKVVYIPQEDTSLIAQSAVSLFKSGTMMDALQSDFFKTAMSEEYKLRNRMVTYNYRLHTVLEAPYTLGDFNDIFDCYVRNDYTVIPSGHTALTTSADTSSHFIIISAATGNEELSKSMCERATELLMAEVTGLIGDFKYEVIDKATDIDMPQADNGLIPITSTGSVVTTERPLLSNIVKSSLKTAAWGVVIASFLAVFISFFMEVTNVKFTSISEVREFGIPVLATVRSAKTKDILHPVGMLIEHLEDDERACKDMKTAVELSVSCIYKLLPESGKIRKILITGSQDSEILSEIKEIFIGFNKSHDIEFCSSAYVSDTPETVDMIDDHTAVILVERINKSTKGDYAGELRYFELIDCKVLGTIILK